MKADIVDDSLRVVGKEMYCITDNDSAVLVVQPTNTIQWFKDNVPILNGTQTVFHVRQSGTYYAFLSNNEGCNVTTIKKDIFIDVPKPGITYPIKFALANVPLTLKARPIGKTALWAPSVNLNDPAVFTPAFTGADDRLYNVTITAVSGCVTTDTQFVKIVSHVEIYVPTAFTPNADGKNDLLRPLLRGVKDLHYFRIFNRLGQLLYETHSEYEGWNGLIGGNVQQTQTVVWVVEGTGNDDKVYKKTGSTVLVR